MKYETVICVCIGPARNPAGRLGAAAATVTAEEVEEAPAGEVGSRFILRAGAQRQPMWLPLHGLYNVDNCLAAAACDSFAAEPPGDAGLLALPNFLATPHIGGSAEEAILAMGRAAIAGLADNAVPDPLTGNL